MSTLSYQHPRGATDGEVDHRFPSLIQHYMQHPPQAQYNDQYSLSKPPMNQHEDFTSIDLGRSCEEVFLRTSGHIYSARQ